MVNRSLKRHNSTKKMTMKNRSTKKGGIKKISGKRMSSTPPRVQLKPSIP